MKTKKRPTKAITTKKFPLDVLDQIKRHMQDEGLVDASDSAAVCYAAANYVRLMRTQAASPDAA